MTDIHDNLYEQGTLEITNEANEYTTKLEMLEKILNNLTIVPNQTNNIMQTLKSQKENSEYDRCFSKEHFKAGPVGFDRAYTKNC